MELDFEIFLEGAREITMEFERQGDYVFSAFKAACFLKHLEYLLRPK